MRVDDLLILGAPRTSASTSLGLSPSSVRAYRSDIDDVERWCLARGLHGGLTDLDRQRVFAYLVELARMGRSSATIRRRLSALRAWLTEPTGARIGLTREDLAGFESPLTSSATDRTGVLVVSDDPIVRAGLSSVLSQSGVLCWPQKTAEFDPATLTAWDYVLIWLDSEKGLDQHAAATAVRVLDLEAITQVPVVAVYPGTISAVLRLRLAEAGIRYAIPHRWLSDNLGTLSESLKNADIPLRYHLETPLAVRQSLGFALAGDLGALLDAASRLPDIVWSSELPQSELPITRREIVEIRRIALGRAGIPAPDFAKYSTSLRSAPDLPEWSVVRRTVRAAWGMDA